MRPVAFGPQSGQESELATPRQGRLESKIHTCLSQRFDPRQHEPSRLDGQALRIEGRETRGDQVSIDELSAVRIVRQETLSKRALARTVRTRDDVDVRSMLLGH